MVLNNGKKDIELKFKTKAFMGLRSKLKCENLRETLIKGCAEENLEMLATGIMVFSGGDIGSINDAYECIDRYCEDNGDVRRMDMFVTFITELGEHGFFGESKSEKEIKAMVADPYLGMIDEKEVSHKILDLVQKKAIEMMADEQMASILTGANTSVTSEDTLTAAG